MRAIRSGRRSTKSRRHRDLGGHASIPSRPPAIAHPQSPSPLAGAHSMSMITTKDGTQIYYKDWGKGQPVVFSHGWPLSSDAWESQMFFLASHGYRCIAHDRRGHGRSSQPWNGNDMDTYADDLAELFEALDLKRRRDDRPLHRRRRSRALHRAARHQARIQGRADGRGAADHAQDTGESRRSADRGLRRLPRRLPGRSLAVLPGRRQRTVLRFQPAGGEGLPGSRSTPGGCRA